MKRFALAVNKSTIKALDFTTRFYRDYNEAIERIPKKSTRIQWKVGGPGFFDRGSSWTPSVFKMSEV